MSGLASYVWEDDEAVVCRYVTMEEETAARKTHKMNCNQQLTHLTNTVIYIMREKNARGKQTMRPKREKESSFHYIYLIMVGYI